MASKKDLMAATKNATESIKGLDKKASEVSEKMLTPVKVKKPNSDYLRFDLRPATGKDYKAYIEEQARLESVKCGTTVSATKYLHSLIDRDMENQGMERTTKTEIMEMLDKVGESEMKEVKRIITSILALCK